MDSDGFGMPEALEQARWMGPKLVFFVASPTPLALIVLFVLPHLIEVVVLLILLNRLLLQQVCIVALESRIKLISFVVL